MVDQKVELKGRIASGFEAVGEAFLANFAEGKEVGASFAMFQHGLPLVDIWAGHADAAKTRDWEADSIVNVYSTTKGMTALALALLVDEGKVDYDAKVTDYWPEFAAAGKHDITVSILMSHQAGLCGVTERISLEDLYNWDRMVGLLAAQEPFWEPGTANGYHAMTYGYLAGEIIARVTGQTPGNFFRERIAEPLGADFHIGLPESEDHRVAEMIAPGGGKASTSGIGQKDDQKDGQKDEKKSGAKIDIKPPKHFLAALANPTLTSEEANTRAWRAAEIPAGNGQGNARSVARVYAMQANGGELEDVRIISEDGIAASTRECCNRKDLILGFGVRWGHGYILNSKNLYGPVDNCFGHSGWGGSFGFADLDNGLGVGYVMNQMDTNVAGDPRGARLIEAVYGCLR